MIEKNKKTARAKAMDYLARRDHSEKELREKLALRYSDEDINQALDEIRERGWLLPPEELSEKVAKSLSQRHKSHAYINHFLCKRGLPKVPKDENLELDKALDVIASKAKKRDDFNHLQSLLKNRGFDTDTIRKAVHETLRNTPKI